MEVCFGMGDTFQRRNEVSCPPFDNKKNDAMLAIGQVLQEEAKADPTIGVRGLANWMGIAERIYDALNPPSQSDRGEKP